MIKGPVHCKLNEEEQRPKLIILQKIKQQDDDDEGITYPEKKAI